MVPAYNGQEEHLTKEVQFNQFFPEEQQDSAHAPRVDGPHLAYLIHMLILGIVLRILLLQQGTHKRC